MAQAIHEKLVGRDWAGTGTVLIGEDDSMENKIVLLNDIVHLGPPVWRCRGPLYKVVWQLVFTTALTAISTTTSTGPQSPQEVATTRLGRRKWRTC